MGFVTLSDIARAAADMGEDPMEDAVFMGGRKGAQLPPPPPPSDPNAPLTIVPGAPMPVAPMPGAPLPGDPMAAPMPGAPSGGPSGFDAAMPPMPSAQDDEAAARRSSEPMIFGVPRKQVLLIGGGIGILLLAVVVKKLKKASQPPPQWGPPPGWAPPPQQWGPPPGWAPPQPHPQAAPAAQAQVKNPRNSILYEATLGGPAHIEQVTLLPSGLAEFHRYGRLVRRFKPTETQARKIRANKGVIRISSKQIR